MSRNLFTKPFPQIATMRFCSDIWNMRDCALSNRSNLKFEYLNKIDTKCKSMLINLLVTPLGRLVWWEKKVLWHWVVLFCLLNIHETSPYFIYSVRCYLLVGIAYWNAKKNPSENVLMFFTALLETFGRISLYVTDDVFAKLNVT